MSEPTPENGVLREISALNERIESVASDVVDVRRGLVREVAKRRSEQARVARLVLEQEAMAVIRSENPAFAWDNLRGCIRSGVEDPAMRRLAYYPAGQFNPYMEILYSKTAEAGWDSSPLREFSDLDSLQEGDLFHLHWTKFVTSTATTEDEAANDVDQTLAALDRAIGRGVIFMWTVHELAPHECLFPEEEFRLRRGLVKRARLVHVLHRSTESEVSEHYAIPPSKVLLAEHPLYTGFYPRFISRASARRELGLTDETVFLSFGAIRPYKGIDRLEWAVAEAQRRGATRCKLLVAGPHYQNVDVGDLLLDLASSSHTLLAADAVPPPYVHVLFEAADIAVLPYRAFHNSGVAMLALSFGTPVLVVDTPVTRDLAGSGLVEYFDGSDEGLVEALERLVESPPARNEPQPEFIERFAPHRVAGEFAGALERLI